MKVFLHTHLRLAQVNHWISRTLHTGKQKGSFIEKSFTIQPYNESILRS